MVSDIAARRARSLGAQQAFLIGRENAGSNALLSKLGFEDVDDAEDVEDAEVRF